MIKLFECLKFYRGKYSCYFDRHLWGPKSRYSMYSYVEECKRSGCKAKMIDSHTIIKEK